MAAFASCRRSGWVRVLVVILCALFIFATVATPPAYAVGETAALFTAAAVLSAAVAALGFKLSNDSDGIATLNKMVTDFSKEVWALNVLVVGNRINGLIDGMNYIKMAVHNGKTYLDERVIAWCQQWLSNNGVYDAGDLDFLYSSGGSVTTSFNGAVFWQSHLDSFVLNSSSLQSAYNKAISQASYLLPLIVEHYNLTSNDCVYYVGVHANYRAIDRTYVTVYRVELPFSLSRYVVPSTTYFANSPYYTIPSGTGYSERYGASYNGSSITWDSYSYDSLPCSASVGSSNGVDINLTYGVAASASSNSTGLSGTDTIGEDYKDKTLDQILDGLKTWAQDWYDAGADSATNTATGALDLPVTVGDQAATANPALNPDVVYNPPFSIPWPGVRSGETSSGAISDGKANADAAETATTDVAENQTVIDSLVNWALGYINPDTGLFSKFPLCVPYDAYLLVTSSLGVDAVGSDSIFGASPGDLDGVVSQGIETYSDFQPIINIKHDFELDGVTYPLELTIDLTPWQPLVTFFREGMALLLVAELIGAEFKRIRGH